MEHPTFTTLDDQPVTGSEFRKHMEHTYVQLDTHNDNSRDMMRCLTKISLKQDEQSRKQDEQAQKIAGFTNMKTWVVGGLATLGGTIGATWGPPFLSAFKLFLDHMGGR